jgi:hypothetical protein
MSVDQSDGHLFVIDGDLTLLDCDAVLVPTDQALQVEAPWAPMLGMDAAGRLPHRLFPVGDRVMRWDGQAKATRPIIWLGDIGTFGPSARWFVDGLEEFVEEAGRALRNAGGTAVPRLAVPVVGTGRGGSGRDKGAVFRKIVPALRAAAAKHRVDVVLVCFGDKPYSAAQRARLALAPPMIWAELETTVERLAGYAQHDQLALFIGAGVSMGAGLPSWKDLISGLAGSLGDESTPGGGLDDLDVRDQAELLLHWYRDRQKDLSQTVRERIGAFSRYSLAHGLLASMHARENVTTNYDRLFESAATSADRPLAILPRRPVHEIDQRWLLKLHGSVDDDGPIVLTRSDYLGLPARSGALFGILQAQLLTRHMLFVGYSLTDDTFHQVVHEVRAAIGTQTTSRLGTALVLFRDRRLELLWGDVLHVVPMMEASPSDATSEDARVAARQLDIVLDEVARRSADVTAFLLDPDYRSMLDPVEKRIARHLARMPALDDAQQSPLVDKVEKWLRDLGRQTPTAS